MRRGAEFTQTFRSGSRSGTRRVVAHLVTRPTCAEPVRVGFVVSKAVGGAVVRNTVKRRLRAAVAAQLGTLPEGTLAVVRALPPSAQASYSDLSDDVASVIGRAQTRAQVRR